MTITDHNLISLLSALTPAERKSVAAHLSGVESRESWGLIRRLRRALKRKVRNRLPKKLLWLA